MYAHEKILLIALSAYAYLAYVVEIAIYTSDTNPPCSVIYPLVLYMLQYSINTVNQTWRKFKLRALLFHIKSI